MIDIQLDGLNKDSPVAMLNWLNDKLTSIEWIGPEYTSNENFETHWVVITGITENKLTNEVTLYVISWGDHSKLSLNDIYSATGVLADFAFVYFDWD